MSTTFETPAQYERDFRSARQEWKRGKNSATKWHFGARPLHGCRVDFATGEILGGNDSQRVKSRPRGKASDVYGSHVKQEHNITKLTRGNWDMPSGRVRTTANAREEIADTSRSLADLAPAPLARRLSAAADSNVMYSFDRADSPGRPLTLDIFVKQASARDTERLVEKEYEVVDENGLALKGRRATRRNLRKTGASDLAEHDDAVNEDDDFELV